MFDIDNIDTEEFKKKEFTIADTKFVINKLNAYQGMLLLDKIRVSLFASEIGDSSNELAMLLKSIAGFPHDKLIEIQGILFAKVQYCKKGDNAKLYLSSENHIDMAFGDGEPVDIYELLLRCLAVNFTNSFKKIADKAKGLILQDTKPKLQS